MSGHERSCVAGNARVLREFCTQAALVRGAGQRPVLILWMQENWSYQCLTGKHALAAILEIAGEYTDHVLGLKLAPAVVVGRVNCYRRKP